jgi:His-Xaa-Ser system protein HxsD
MNNIEIKIEEKLYPLYTIIATAYKFLDKYYIFLSKNGERTVNVSIKGKEKIKDEEKDNIKDEFLNELISVRARLSASERNKKIRELIVGRALFSSSEEEKEEEYDKNDPLGINVPWNQ